LITAAGAALTTVVRQNQSRNVFTNAQKKIRNPLLIATVYPQQSI
jgi:hypothetical protein